MLPSGIRMAVDDERLAAVAKALHDVPCQCHRPAVVESFPGTGVDAHMERQGPCPCGYGRVVLVSIEGAQDGRQRVSLHVAHADHYGLARGDLALVVANRCPAGCRSPLNLHDHLQPEVYEHGGAASSGVAAWLSCQLEVTGEDVDVGEGLAVLLHEGDGQMT